MGEGWKRAVAAACPMIATYEHFDGPMVARWLARFVVVKHVKNKGDLYEELPMIFRGATEEAAKGAAVQFWQAETAKMEAKRINLAKARQARRRLEK